MANILVADSDPAILKVISEALKGMGHEIVPAEDGNKALEILKQNSIQLMLTEKELPGKDGLELLHELKISRTGIPVIMMLGGDEDDPDEILEAGAKNHISKPFNVQDLRNMVSETLPPEVSPPKPEKQEDVSTGTRPVLRRTLTVILLAAVSGSAGMGLRFWYKYRHEPVLVFAVTDSHISGIAPDGHSLWSCDWYDQSIYRHNMDAILTVSQTSIKKDSHPTALAWDGTSLWTASSWNGNLCENRASDPIVSLRCFTSPLREPSGLCSDGGTFWMTGLRDQKIVHFRIEGNEVKILETFQSPGQRPVGVARVKKYLWTADDRSGLIFKHSIEQNLKVVKVYSLPDDLQKEKISCFAGDGKEFWVGSESSQKIFRIPPQRLKLVGTVE